MAKELKRRLAKKLPDNWAAESTKFIAKIKASPAEMATRKASKVCLDVYGPLLPELFGGSADLTGSNLTLFNSAKTFSATEQTGNYLYYGVREFGMFAIMNGIALHGGFIPYAGTFLTFVDYGKNAVRLSALMQTHTIFVLTHDSIGLGEDGPTHQPIEQIAMLRLIPGLNVWRPANELETAVAWQHAIEHHVPSCLLLTRQNVPAAKSTEVADIQRGGYIALDSIHQPVLILIATGSEVAIALAAAEKLQQEGIAVRVVSMPCVELFEQQPESYRNSVLPNHVTRRIVIEAGATATWYKYVGLSGKVIGIDRFGESAPCKAVYQELKITVEHIIESAHTILKD